MLFRGGFYVEWESVQVSEYVEIILENVIVLQVCLHSFFFLCSSSRILPRKTKKKQRQVLELRDKPHPIIKQT